MAWLRNLNRGTKFAVLLLAAWAPFLSTNYPTVTGMVMGIATAIFFVATGRSRPPESPTGIKITEVPHADG